MEWYIFLSKNSINYITKNLWFDRRRNNWFEILSILLLHVFFLLLFHACSHPIVLNPACVRYSFLIKLKSIYTKVFAWKWKKEFIFFRDSNCNGSHSRTEHKIISLKWPNNHDVRFSWSECNNIHGTKNKK